MVKVENEFGAMAMACIFLSIAISGSDLYRRYKQEKKYLGRNSKKNGNELEKVHRKEPKKRAKGQQ